jgi:hypothetical protein
MILLPEKIQAFVSHLADSGYRVWLIGSRANDTAHETSDWDLLVFGNEALIGELADQRPIENVDVLVVYDGNNFCSPWNDKKEGIAKAGSLADWDWQEQSDTKATYKGTKWPQDWGSLKHAKRF